MLSVSRPLLPFMQQLFWEVSQHGIAGVEDARGLMEHPALLSGANQPMMWCS